MDEDGVEDTKGENKDSREKGVGFGGNEEGKERLKTGANEETCGEGKVVTDELG